MTDNTHRWLTVPEAARYFQKDASQIRRWCYDGTAIEAGWKVHRDHQGYWRIGIPRNIDVSVPCNA